MLKGPQTVPRRPRGTPARQMQLTRCSKIQQPTVCSARAPVQDPELNTKALSPVPLSCRGHCGTDGFSHPALGPHLESAPHGDPTAGSGPGARGEPTYSGVRLRFNSHGAS